MPFSSMSGSVAINRARVQYDLARVPPGQHRRVAVKVEGALRLSGRR